MSLATNAGGGVAPHKVAVRPSGEFMDAFDKLPISWRDTIAASALNWDPVGMREARQRWLEAGLEEDDQLFRLRGLIRIRERQECKGTYGPHHPQAQAVFT